MDVPGAFANNNKYNLKEWKIKCNLERHPGQKWLFKGEIRIWSGTRWFCKHNRERAKCTICKGGSRRGAWDPPLFWVGSVGLCRHNFEHQAISGTVGIMLA